MPERTAIALLAIAGAAVVAPLLAELLRRWRVPSVLFELLLGILIGPAVLDLAEKDTFVTGLSTIGLAFLFFVAGYELDFGRLRGAPLNRGVFGWFTSLALGLAVAGVLVWQDFVLSDLLVGLALTTTAIGTLLPMLSDRGLLETRFGDFIAAAGAAGEFGPILAVAVLLGSTSPFVEGLLLITFVIVAVAVAFLASRSQPPRLVELLQRHLTTSTQLPVRIIMLLVAVMVVVAASLGLDMLLGAFTAGMIAHLALHPEQAEALEPKIQSIGYGFLIPVFFVVSGIDFDAAALWEEPSTLLRVPLFLGLFLLVRGLPALLVYRGLLPGRERLVMVFLQSTALPMLVVLTHIGLETDRMRSDNATALVGAGMLSVLLLPLVSFGILGDEPSEVQAPVTHTSPRVSAGSRSDGKVGEGRANRARLWSWSVRSREGKARHWTDGS